ncbi:hypothetical protein TKK_0005514 [Trichogramma kaykai]|uniref:DUF7041 domain-containing protein n=1 Tax=Trichogramma kaykai TaxID=54128 RepID=A0ABD2XIR1_9HYME
MGDNPSSNYAQSAPRVPDDSRLHLLQENFGSSQSPVVDAVEALKELPLKELTDSIKMLTENVMELRSGASSNSAQQNNFINDAVRQTLASANFRGNAFASVQSPIINSHVDLLSLGEANPVGGVSVSSTCYRNPPNASGARHLFDPFDINSLPSRDHITPSNVSMPVAPSSSASAIARRFQDFSPFWKKTPEIWIEQIEERFNSLGISNYREKYNITLTALGGDVIAELADSVRNLPAERKYEALKNILMRKYVEHPKALMNKFYEILGGPQCNKRPSEFLDALCGSGSSFLDRGTILQFWKMKLPPQIAVHLSSNIDLQNERELVVRVDEVFYQLRNPNRVLHKIDIDKINDNEQACNRDSEFKGFMIEIKEVIKEMSRSISQLGRPNTKQSRGDSSSPYCYYHRKYKEKALKCPPETNCKWKEHFPDQPKN